MKQSTFLNTLN